MINKNGLVFIISIILSFIFVQLFVVNAESIQPTLLWEKTFPKEIRDFNMSDNGERIVVNTEDRIYVLDRKGNMEWQIQAQEAFDPDTNTSYLAVFKYSTISGDGHFVGTFTMSEGVLLYDKFGKKLWNDIQGYGAVYISKNGKTIVIVDDEEGTIYIKDSSGNLLWQKDITWFNPVISENGELIAFHDGIFGRNGNLLWKFRTYGIPFISDSGDIILVNEITDPPTKAFITLYNRTGEILWEQDLESGAILSRNGQFVLIMVWATKELVLIDKKGKTILKNTSFDLSKNINISISNNADFILIDITDLQQSQVVLLNKQNQKLWELNMSVSSDAIKISKNGQFLLLGPESFPGRMLRLYDTGISEK